MPKLLLIRHCQSTGRHPDAPLSEAGAKAAEALITRLHDLAPDAVYSSPYERAHATVRPFAISAGLSVGLDDRLRERVLSDRDLEDRLTTSAGRSPSRTTVRQAERASIRRSNAPSPP
jgi:2,3-bisphosphoglycerate-dependent phosphoglycerate mutase